MRSNLSVGDVLQQLEAQIAALREKEALHAQQEAFHREQRSACGEELARMTGYLAAFEAASSAVQATGKVRRTARPEDEDAGFKPMLSRLVARVVETVDPGTQLGSAWVTAEVERRFGQQLRRAVDPRLVAVALRRMHERGLLVQVRKGRPHWEALYSRGEA